MSTKGKRLDLLLEEAGYFPSRQVARTAIMDGGVIVNGEKISKPGTLIKDGAKIQLTNNWQVQKYVSRGGLKLEKALAEFKIPVAERVCLDVGASTGGFTDCLLQAGAQFVYAIDVGYGQIAWSLRTDSRVKVIERTNARALNPELLYAEDPGTSKASLAVIDVSFISLAKVLPAVKQCLQEGNSVLEIIALVKPQFEAGPGQVGKKGVVRSPEIHKQVILQVMSAASDLGLYARKLTFSPLKGPEGNVEFLILLSNIAPAEITEENVDQTVQGAQSI